MKQGSELVIKDKLSYLWLALSLVLLIFSGGPSSLTFPLAPWLAYPLLLRFIRTQKSVRGYFLTAITITISSSISWYGVIPMPVMRFLVMQLVINFLVALPYLADRLMYRRFQGLMSTLILPAAITAMAYLFSMSPSQGTFGSIAYTQYGLLPLMQLSSITGIWGIIFILFWFASTVNHCWEREFDFQRIKKTAGIYICVLAAVLIYGIGRMLVIKPPETAVRVAAVTTSSDIVARLRGSLAGKSPFNLQESLEQLESQTTKAAQQGAKIIAWQEYADIISSNDLDTYIKAGQKIAAAKKVYVLMGIAILDISKKSKGENVSILIDPAGNIAWKYLKSHLVPGVEEPYFKKGDKRIPVQNTSYGKIASVICFDFDFPAYIRSAGKDIGLFLVPSFDWKEITPMHSHMAVFRAIENGFSLARTVGKGLSIATDCCGRVIAEQNYFTSKERIMLADMPVQAVFTVYSVIGDALAWLCIAGFFMLIIVAMTRGEQNKRA